jgi:TonB family protein
MRQRAFSIVTTLALLIALASTVAPFGPVAKAADTPTEGPVGKLPGGRDYYPWRARRQGVTGRVGLEYSVDEGGHARNIVVLESGGALLDDGARKLLADLRFDIPPDWVATGGPAQRYRFGVIFELTGKPRVLRFEDKRRTVTITSVPGSA